MKDLALRDGFEEPGPTEVDGEEVPPDPEKVKQYERMIRLMVKYWNVLLPKVCGSAYWSVTKNATDASPTMLPTLRS